jgi:hypothetical protein
MLNQKIITITDDSGFLAIVNADRYNSYVSEDWELPELLNRFVDEMNNDNLIVWSTGTENTWTINFVNLPSDIKSFREFNKSIEVTYGRLYLTNYEDLTMAAQYAEEKLPAKHNAQSYFLLDNGKYELRIRQLFNPDNLGHDRQEELNFEIVVQPYIEGRVQIVDKVFWWRG